MPNNYPLQLISQQDLRLRAEHPNSVEPRPFLRWAGSKRFLLPQLVELLPSKFGTFHEPFLGSGALFFLISPSRAFLSDSCGELIDSYISVRDNPKAVLRYLLPLSPNRTLYYKIRDNPSRGRFKRAAEFIYLNKTCWNGLYRVNSSGKFNVPYGLPRSKTLIDPSNLRSCAASLGKPGVAIERTDFSIVLDRIEKNDLVYLDPPYVIGHSNNGFRDYNEVLFSWEDQVRLADTARRLVSSGAHVLITNAYHAAINILYRDFKTFIVERNATLASDISKRGRVKESIFVS
jgi:DNA adenine methylase